MGKPFLDKKGFPLPFPKNFLQSGGEVESVFFITYGDKNRVYFRYYKMVDYVLIG